jgi:hypothetical protein
MNCKTNSILSCPKFCIEQSNSTLIETIKERLDDKFPEYQLGFTHFKNLSHFHTEASRSFHFPALECIGKNPHIAILGITKGSSQVEAALKLLSEQITSTNNLSIEELCKLINNTCIHAVFAGKQIRRNISNLFQKIDLWNSISIKFNNNFPEKNVDDIIGCSYQEPNTNFYIASFIKCALLTMNGKSDAPSYKEILKIKGAINCIENNFMPAFSRYPNLKTLITFGKTSYDFVNNIRINGELIIEHLNNLNIIPIFLPHPSGANIHYLNKYLIDQLDFPWITKPNEARQILLEKFK